MFSYCVFFFMTSNVVRGGNEPNMSNLSFVQARLQIKMTQLKLELNWETLAHARLIYNQVSSSLGHLGWNAILILVDENLDGRRLPIHREWEWGGCCYVEESLGGAFTFRESNSACYLVIINHHSIITCNHKEERKGKIGEMGENECIVDQEKPMGG